MNDFTITKYLLLYGGLQAGSVYEDAHEPHCEALHMKQLLQRGEPETPRQLQVDLLQSKRLRFLEVDDESSCESLLPPLF